MKRVELYPGKVVTAYQGEDLKEWEPVISEATEKWRSRCKAHADAKKPDGTCVLGAGFSVYFIPPKCRKPVEKMIIFASSVAHNQDSLNWEESKTDIEEFIRSKGLDVHYKWGNMD